MSNAPIMERLSALEAVEKEILGCLQSAGQCLNEMGKDKPSQKQVDIHTNHFIKTLNHVELEMTKHINYLTQVSTGQAHEGSSYAAQKTLQMAWHRSEHARSKVMELERNKNQVLTASLARQRAASAAAGSASNPLSLPPTPQPVTTSASQPPPFMPPQS